MPRHRRGRKRTRHIVAALVLLSEIVCGGVALSEAAVSGFDPETDYIVVYEVGDNAESIKPVKILELTVIGSRTFMVVSLAGYKARAYVDLQSIRSILPYGR